MKIVQVNTFINSRSTGRIAEEIGKLVLNQGWDSYFAFGREPKESASKPIKIGNGFDMAWHGITSRVFDRHAFGSKRATKILVDKIKEINPDIIHLHNIHGYYLNITVFFEFLQKSNIPVIWTLHDCWPYTGHCAYYSFVGCEKWKSECNTCPQLETYPKSFFLDNSRKNYRDKMQLFNSLSNLTIVPVSNWLEKEAKQSFLQQHKFQVINNGVDIAVFKPVEKEHYFQNNNLKDKFVILGVANVWEKRKGLEDFMELSKKISDDELILLVGLDEQQIKKLPSNVVGISRTENIDELVAMYSNAGVLFNPTWEDNFPTTNLEAMACGTPVVTYDTGGSPEALTEETGFVVPQGDLQAVLKKMRIIKEMSEDGFKERCRERVERFYDKNERYMEYIELYQKLLKSNTN